MVNVTTFNLLICVAEWEFIYLFIFVGVGGCVVGIMWGVCEHEFPFHECHEALNVTFSLPA